MIQVQDQLAFLGLGGMGKAICTNLAQKSSLKSPLLVWNRTEAVSIDFCSSVGKVVQKAEIIEISEKADIIWTCVKDATAVKELYEHLLSYDVSGKLFVDCSSVPADVTNKLSQRLNDNDASFVSMPVFGDPSVAKLGKLVCVPAGPRGSVERLKPFLVGVIAKGIIDLSGEQPGKASTLKLIGNTLILNTIELVAEAHVLGEKAGISSESIQDLIASYFSLSPYSIYSTKMVNGGYYRTAAAAADVRMAQGLASHVLGLAKSSGASLKSYETAVEHLADAERHAGPGVDVTAIFGAVRAESGLPFQSKQEQ